jgi:DHA2 family metal-tetracycline-proton antiporter-like MFS transporter
MNIKNDGIAPNSGRLLWAGFVAILAAGVGFAIRGGILGIWSAKFGFTGLEVGLINGAGFTGFCFGIIAGGLIVDRIGYGKLVVAAFLFHMLSAVVTFGATDGMTTKTAFVYLWTGTFLFALANGTLEAVANPLVATLFPKNRTHYLNILHASWPAGMVLGSFIGGYWGESLDWSWKTRLALFLIPTAIYGFMFMGQHFPKSEASQKGLKLGDMLKDVGIIGSAVVGLFIFLFIKDGLGPLLNGLTGKEFFSSTTWTYVSILVGAGVWLGLSNLSRWATGAWLVLVLFVTHALVGAVELGTDGWIQNITGNILTPKQGTLLFVFTSAIMFALRFCADFIEKKLKLSPVGILLVCALLACLGLNLVSGITAFGGAFGALAVYAVGKTFFWPTMLAVVGDRFPRTGAVAMSIMGGLGMMSAGLIGSPGLGYAKDRFASEALQHAQPAVYEEYKVQEAKGWLFLREVQAIDGRKLGEVQARLNEARSELEKTGIKDPNAAVEKLTPTEKAVYESSISGDRKTLRADAFIPAVMALIFLLMLIYFKSIGGYKPVHLQGTDASKAGD